MRPTYSDAEIACYRAILVNPGCTIEQLSKVVPYDYSTVRISVHRLTQTNVVRRRRDDEHRTPGPSPFLHWATRGTDPIEQAHRDSYLREHKRKVMSNRAKKRPRVKSKGWLMTKADWEAVVINYERLHPGDGNLIIHEHIQMRQARGEKPCLSLKDWPRLRRVAEALNKRGLS